MRRILFNPVCWLVALAFVAPVNVLKAGDGAGPRGHKHVVSSKAAAKAAAFAEEVSKKEKKRKKKRKQIYKFFRRQCHQGVSYQFLPFCIFDNGMTHCTNFFNCTF